MKLHIFNFIISISYCLSEIIDENDIAKYPKRHRRGSYIVQNSGNYIKSLTSSTRKNVGASEYTAFPQIHIDEFKASTSKPSFDIKQTEKILPDYIWHSLRDKRSADLNGDEKIKKRVRRQAERAHPGKAEKAHKPVKINKTVKVTKPAKIVKINKVNKNTKQTIHGKRIKKRPRNPKLRSGANRKHKSIRKNNQQRNQNRGKIRPKFGKMQATKKRRTTRHRSKLSNTTKKSQKGARRLISARDTEIEEYPYVISIQKERQHWCAGALLHQRLAITTANCLWKGQQVSRMRVRAGSRYTDRGGQVAYIQEVMKHPGWSIRKEPDNDVALMLLDRKIRFSNSVHGVDLPNRVMMPAFEDAWVTSWGAERRDGVYQSQENSLQVYHARLMDRQKCNNITQRFGIYVTENFICMAQTGKRAPCTRDTGAPAVSDGVLWGLASWGIRKLCGTERFPAMFSYLGSQTNMDFIINASHRLMADERFSPYLDREPVVRVMLTMPTEETLPY